MRLNTSFGLSGAVLNFLLLPSASIVHRCESQPRFRIRAGTRAPQFRALRLRLCGYARARHLLISEPQRGTLADVLKSLKQGVSRRLIGEAEHFWQKRYCDFNIRDYQQFVEKLRYIHRNPVKRGLCERAEDWAWSSFRHYANGSERRVEIESQGTSRKRERLGRVPQEVQQRSED